MSLKETIDFLVRKAMEKPEEVISNLALGTKIRKSMGLSYVIDDLNIDKQLGDFPAQVIPYGPIYRALKSNPVEAVKLRKGREVMPFSEMFNAKLGECLERAILVQMAAQRDNGISFLINGALLKHGEDCVESHAYNIIVRNNRAFLVDAQNPLRVDTEGKVSVAYIAPINRISGEINGIEVSSEWEQGRTYMLR